MRKSNGCRTGPCPDIDYFSTAQIAISMHLWKDPTIRIGVADNGFVVYSRLRGSRSEPFLVSCSIVVLSYDAP
jgi:hypothetical protein